MATRLKEHYDTVVRPALMKEFAYENLMAVPRLDKIVINMGVGEAVQDTKKVDAAAKELAVIAGQRPVITHAKKSIATYKVRENMPLGCKVTLRKDRMYEFLDRLVNIALAARARLPRQLGQELRRARQLRARIEGAARLSRNQLRRGRRTCAAWTSSSSRPPRPMPRPRRCCAASTSRS